MATKKRQTGLRFSSETEELIGLLRQHMGGTTTAAVEFAVRDSCRLHGLIPASANEGARGDAEDAQSDRT